MAILSMVYFFFSLKQNGRNLKIITQEYITITFSFITFEMGLKYDLKKNNPVIYQILITRRISKIKITKLDVS